MASFTDDLQYLTKHTPYVQQLPVQEMAQVGQYKQAQYDQGVQKIQSEIDKVAGMDVVRDVDKAYLQSRLNDLGGNLKKVAAGDFSNYQLTNSVGGMITKIGKDTNVQNAVGSTANWRTQLAKIQKDVDEGKSNPANIDYFQKQANAWMGGQKPGEKFSSAYVPYFDVFKHAKETFDAIKPDGYSFDQIYITDAAGNVKTDSEGRPVASPIMKRLEKEGVFPEKVRQALNQVFLDPRVNQQLSISGEYALKNQSPEMLSNRIQYQKNELIDNLTERKNLLNLQKNIGKNVQDEIDSLQLAIDNTRVKYDDFAKMAYQSPDAVRASLYKDEIKNNYTAMFGWTKSKEQTLDNPLWNANFKLNQETNKIKQWNEEMKFKKEKEKFDQKAKTVELNLKAQELAQKESKGNGKVKQTFERSDEAFVETFDNKYTAAAADYSAKSNDFVYNTVLQTPENDVQLEKYIRAGQTKEEAINTLMKDKIRQQLALKGQVPDERVVEDQLAQEKTKWELKAISEINTAGNLKKPSIQDSKEAYMAAKKEFEIATGLKDEAERRMGKDLADKLKSSNYKISPVKANIDGVNIDVAPEDMLNAAIYLKALGQGGFLDGMFGSKDLQDKAKQAKSDLLSAGKGELIDYMEDHIQEFIEPVTADSRFDAPVAAFQNTKLVSEFRKLFKNIDTEGYKAALKSKADVIKQMGFTVSPNLTVDLLSGNVEADRDLSEEILAIAGQYSSHKQNLSDKFNYAKIREIVNSDDSAKSFNMKTRKNDVTGEVQAEVVFYDTDGSEASSMVITPEEASALNVNTSILYESEELQGLRNRMNASPLGSTSVNDPYDKATYISGDGWFQKNYFTNLNGTKYDVQANLVKRNGLIYPIVYVMDDVVKPEPRELPGQKDVGDAVDKLKSITPTFINLILNEK